MLSTPDPLGLELARALTGPVARRDVSVATGELELHAVIWGRDQDPPVLLLHGNGAHAHWWDPLVPRLARGRRLIALDLRGHGESGRPREIAYRLADYERDLVAVLDALAPGPVPVIAHSMGARAAIWLAARHPERVLGMALIDTVLAGIDWAQAEAFRLKIRDRRDGAAYASYAEAIAAYRLVPEERDVPDAVMRNIAHHALVERAPGEWCVRFDRGVLLHGDGSGALFDELAGVRCPVRVAYARRAPRQHDREIETARARLPGMRIEEFDGGHHFFLARPEPLGGWLVEFLDILGAGV